MFTKESGLLQGTLELLVLKTLSWGPMHGYGVAKWIESATDDVLSIEEGSLYPALYRMTRRGWIKGIWGVSENNRRAKFYHLTAEGRAAVSGADVGVAEVRRRGHAGRGHGHSAELGELTMRNPFSHPDGRRPFESAPQAEVGDELEFHLEQRIRDYIARGMDPDTARATALERFGDVSGVQRECTELLEDDRRAEARRDWISDLKQDLRFGVRSAMHAKLFTLLAVVTLAFGIGANAAVFGVVKSVLLMRFRIANPRASCACTRASATAAQRMAR